MRSSFHVNSPGVLRVVCESGYTACFLGVDVQEGPEDGDAYKQTNERTNKQSIKQSNKQTNTQTNKQTNKRNEAKLPPSISTSVDVFHCSSHSSLLENGRFVRPANTIPFESEWYQHAQALAHLDSNHCGVPKPQSPPTAIAIANKTNKNACSNFFHILDNYECIIIIIIIIMIIIYIYQLVHNCFCFKNCSSHR